jgi:hypothetical protein
VRRERKQRILPRKVWRIGENSKELNAEEDFCGEIARLNLWRKKAKRLLITLLWRNHKSLIVWSLQQDYIWGKNHVVKV